MAGVELPASTAAAATAADELRLRALAFFDFCRQHPRDLDLGFYLFRGMQPRGLTPRWNERLNGRLRDAMRPQEAALRGLGFCAEEAITELTALLAHTAGLLLLSHTGPHPHVRPRLGRPLRAVGGGHHPPRPCPSTHPETPMKLDRECSALVLVDYQGRLMPAIAGGEAAVREAVFLARVARAVGVPVLGTEQNPQGLGPNVEAVRACCEQTLPKMHFDATADGLVELLGGTGRPPQQVVVAGCEAHVCLLQTALGLLAAGLQVVVVPDACGSRSPADKALAMRRLERSGATLVCGEMVAFEWLRSCRDEHFKAVLQLVKERPVAGGT